MADLHTGRLCVQIIHSHFGSITASIASTLLIRGRLPFPQIVRLTGLKPRTVLSSILVLVQHNLLWHSSLDGGEVLEVNIEECLARTSFGRLVFQAEQLFGKPAADVIKIVLDHGKLRPPEIVAYLAASDLKSKALYSQTIHKLVSSSYLKPSAVLSHQSPRDKQIRYEMEEKAKISGFPSAKDLRQAKEVAVARWRREEEEAEQAGMRQAKHLESLNHKKQHDSKAERDGDMVVEENVYFRVNYDKFNIHLRNSLVIKAAKERFNHGAAQVLEAVLSATEASQKSVREIRSDPVSLSNVIWKLSENNAISSGLIYSTKKVSNSTCIKDYLGMMASADNPTTVGKAAAFVSFTSSKVHVEFEMIHRRLRRRVLESVARERHGVEGVRIISLLLDSGKLEEKQISKVVMMTPKDVRTLLTSLAADSLISTQEVPKSADRNPTRTFYLWYVDLQKAYSVILGNLYKTLYNIGMRRLAESQVGEVKAVLEKCERSDVIEDESLLSRHEKTILQEWEAKQKKLTVLSVRIEETVFILRDLGEIGRLED